MWIGGVRVAILDEEDRLLMVCQKHEDRYLWMIPGGAIEDGESSIAACKREVKEETGLVIEVGPMIWCTEQVKEDGQQRFVNYFLAKPVGGNLQLGADPEFDADHQVLKGVKFMTRAEVESLEDIYPVFLKDEFWNIIKNDQGHEVYKLRRNK